MLEGNCIIITRSDTTPADIANVIIPGAASTIRKSGSMSEQVHEIVMAKTYTPQSSFMKTFVNLWCDSQDPRLVR